MNNEVKIDELRKEIERLELELKSLEREKRKAAISVPSEREIAVIEEFEYRTKNGEVLEPLVEKVDLETFVGSETFERVLGISEDLAINTASVRGHEIKFYTPNLRALWQSYGQEYIEPELLDFIEAIDDDGVYFDVGASTGVFAIYAAIRGKRTYCFEPEVTNFNILNTNGYLNFSKVAKKFNAVNIGLSNRFAVDTMFIRRFEAAAHEKILGQSKARDGKLVFEPEYEQRVLTLTMDEFCRLENVQPTDIKIDVDGAEKALIEGMKETLSSPKLKRIFFEVSEVEPDSVKALETILEYGFKVESRKRVQNYFTEYNYTLVRA